MTFKGHDEPVNELITINSDALWVLINPIFEFKKYTVLWIAIILRFAASLGKMLMTKT